MAKPDPAQSYSQCSCDYDGVKLCHSLPAERCRDAASLKAPIGGVIYRHPKYRGPWRCETAGPKWVTLRSLSVVNRGGAWASHRVPRADWPHGWYRSESTT